MYYSGLFANIELTLNLKYNGTACYYGDYLSISHPCSDSIVISEKDITDWMKRWDISDPVYSEYVQSCSYICDQLMNYQRIVFHSAALLWKNDAYLFTAPSGTGKTTQLRLWKKLFPDEADILNGDKPILELCDTGDVLVHPSPWKGKEGYGRDDITAPLKGIIILRQAVSNQIQRVTPADAVKYLFGRIYSTFTKEEHILNAAGILESILNTVPVWILYNMGNEASAKLTHRVLSTKVLNI